MIRSNFYKSLDSKLQEYFKMLHLKCKRAGFKLVPRPGEQVRYPAVGAHHLVEGFFDCTDKILSFGTKNFTNDYTTKLGTVLHEESHLDQYYETDLFNDIDFSEDVYTLKAKKLPKKIRGYLDKCIQLEVDCEIRTLFKLLNFREYIDIPTYVTGANRLLGILHLRREYPLYSYREIETVIDESNLNCSPHLLLTNINDLLSYFDPICKILEKK